ncbi:ABC transporter ATP-binding protein [candidate division KSB1 bacterium]|nr:ABC transporter ATP-binding protein [candidate division KSB1 bacterium]
MTHFQEDEITGKGYDARLMKRLLAFLKPYRLHVVISIILLLGYTFTDLAIPFLIKVAIDDYILNDQFGDIYKIIVLFVGVLLVQFIIQYAQTYLMEWLGQRVILDIRMQVFRHLQRLSLKYFNQNPVGRLVTRVTTDVETLNELFSAGIVSIFGDIFLLIGIVVVMLNINWRLALVTFSVLPILFFIAMMFRIKVRESFRQVRLRIAKINSYLQENISGMLIVQMFNREKLNFKKFDDLNRSHLDAHVRTILYFAIYFPAVELISTIAIALIIWYGGALYLSGAVTFGVLTAFIQYAKRFFRPISDLSEKYNILQLAMASSERIFKLLDQQPLIVNSPRQVAPIDASPHIEFRNVSFRYNDNDSYVLKNVSFDVQKGEKIAIVGYTGAGKTTIINLLCRFYDVVDGEVCLNGINIKDYDLQLLRRHFGLVLQDVFIFSGDIKSNIRLGEKTITDEQIVEAASNVHIHQFIEKLPHQYDEILTERGSTLSMGQKQLLSFARALAFDPDILILDEATSSIDTETELLIQDALKRLMMNRTSIIIAHRLSTIKFCDKIIVIHKGEVREVGTHQQLIRKRGIYYKLYQLQHKINV